MRRREFFGAVGAPLIVGALPGRRQQAPAAAAPSAVAPPKKGRLKQGVTNGVFGRGAQFEDNCREAARLMIDQGGGAILVVGSTSVYTPAPHEAAYRASKAALKAYAEVLALELAPFSIRVNCAK